MSGRILSDGAEDAERKRKVIAEEGVYISAPTGTSMRPMLRAGIDTVAIVAPIGRLKKYDVALFLYREHHVMHRVIKVTEEGYIFRGDNCVAVERCDEADIIGVMESFWRGERRIYASSFTYRLYSRYAVTFSFFRHLPRRVIGRLKRMVKKK